MQVSAPPPPPLVPIRYAAGAGRIRASVRAAPHLAKAPPLSAPPQTARHIEPPRPPPSKYPHSDAPAPGLDAAAPSVALGQPPPCSSCRPAFPREYPLPPSARASC